MLKATNRAIGYLRVSTDKQAESGLGLEAQRSSITAAAQRLGVPLVNVFADAGTSGSLSIEDRPVLLEAVSALKRQDVLLIAKRDRLGRDVVAVALIERLVAKRGARIISAAGEGSDSDDPANVLLRRLLDAFSEHERLLISMRTKAALNAKRQRGERTSRFAPYGCRLAADGRTLEPSHDEQQTLAVIRERRAAGNSLQAIAEWLNLQGIHTRAGTPWRWQYIQSALKRAA